jgi:hypothetical protein
MVAVAEQAGVILMVGYPKRYDPAFARFQQEAAGLAGARLMRVTTFESPLRPYVGHYPLLTSAPLPAAVAERLGRTPTRASGPPSVRPPGWSGTSTRWSCSTRWCTS